MKKVIFGTIVVFLLGTGLLFGVVNQNLDLNYLADEPKDPGLQSPISPPLI